MVSAHFGGCLIPGRPGAPRDDEPVPFEFVDPPPGGRVYTAERRVHLGDVDSSARLRLGAVARYLQDVATDDADDARLPERKGVWVLRSVEVEIMSRPWYHDRLELTTFCSGTGPRWAERRTSIRSPQGTVLEAAAIWVFVDRDRGRPVPLDEDFFAIYGEAARARKVRGRLRHDRPPVGLGSRPWPLRVSDFDVLDHVNNARSLEAMEDELDRQLPAYAPVRVSVEYRGTLQRGDTVGLASEVRGAGDDTELAAWVLVDGEVRISAQIGVQAPDDGRRS
jgi:acyl-ACP thioesterase